MSSMWVKICGVTSPNDASAVVAAGADAIGLNCYPKSKRYVTTEDATHIRNSVGDEVDVVLVFVNAPAGEAAEIVAGANPTAVQFHGDETVETLAEFHRLAPATKIVRAFRIGNDGTTGMSEAVASLQAANVPLAAILVDALVPGEYAGTGHQVPADLLKDRPADWPPLILAGGLTPQVVGSAAKEGMPWGVDTASGVETSPGVKNAEKVVRFVEAVRAVSGPGRVRL